MEYRCNKKFMFLFLFGIILFSSLVSSTLEEPSAYWRFNENPGELNMTDLLGLKNLTLNTHGNIITTGKLFNAVQLNTSGNGGVALNTTGDSLFAFGSGVFSVVYWVNGSSPSSGSYTVMGTANAGGSWVIVSDTAGAEHQWQEGSGEVLGTVGSVNTGVWKRVAWVREGTGANQFKVYVDNVNVANGTLATSITDSTNPFQINAPNNKNVQYDDFRIYKGYALTVDDINTDWNGGYGQQVKTNFDLSITLDTSTNNLQTMDNILTLNSTVVSSVNLTNATVFVYYENSTLFYTENKSVNGLINSTTFNVSGFDVGRYFWNTYYCNQNSSGYNCSFASSNNTFDFGYVFNSQNYSATTYDTEKKEFTLNISYNNSDIVSLIAYLVYNGTSYLGTSSGSGSEKIFTRTIDIPAVSSQQTKNFYWDVSLTTSSGILKQNTTVNTQTVNPSTFTNVCTGISKAVNFTIQDETDLSYTIANFKATFNWKLNESSVTEKNISLDLSGASSYTFCINTNQTFFTDATIELSKTGFETRTYTFNDKEYSNNSITQPLFLVNTTLSTSFIVFVRDSTFFPQGGATVEVERYYPSNGTWALTEVLQTDVDGQSIGHFVAEDVNYRFKVYVGGVLKLTTLPLKVICGTNPCTITLTLPASAGNGLDFFEPLDGVTSTLTYSKTSYVITYTYTDTSSDSLGGRLEVFKWDYGDSSRTTACNVTSSDSSAVLTCDLSSQVNGTYYAVGYIDRTGDLNHKDKSIVVRKVRDIVGSVGLDGVLWAAIFIMAIAMLGLFKPALAIIFTIFGLITVSLIGIVSISVVSIVSVIAIGIILLWEMRR